MTEHKEADFLETIVKGLVTKPEDVRIDRTVDEMGVLYTVNVNEIDISRTIGKNGNVAQAIRLLLKTVGYLHHVRASMKVNIPTKIK
jgi:predicted RNA-binding protein YlqC (UPF0109 family)